MGLSSTTTEPRDLVRTRRRDLTGLFRAAPAGPVPSGRGAGTVLLGTGGLLSVLAAVLSRALVWRGKIVDARAGRLTNLVTPLELHAFTAEVYVQGSWVDGAPCTVLDYSRTSRLARAVRDELREVAPQVYLGPVFLGRRHVLDFVLDFRSRT
jgi:hypothetical protein